MSRTTFPRPTDIKRRLSAVGPEGLGGRAGWSLVVELLGLASSVLVFFALTNLIVRAEIGTMTAVLALAVPVASLTSFGSHVMLIKRIAHGDEIQDVWRRATSVGIIGPALGAVALIALRPLILPKVDFWVFVFLTVSQVSFFWLTELAVFLGNATRRLKESAKLRAIVVACRFLALGLFAIFGGGELIGWAIASFASFGVGAILSLVFVWRVFGARPSVSDLDVGDVREGLPFSVNGASEGLFDGADKVLLKRYDHDDDAAIYGVGGRAIQFGYLPIRILLRASDADIFEAGKEGTRQALKLTRTLLPTGLAIGGLVALAFLIMAPIIPYVAGDEYVDSITTIRYLSILPFIRAGQYLMGNCLSASGHQPWRLGATFAAAGLNIGLNVWLLPTGTWRTAVLTTIVSELFLTAVLCGTVFYWVWREGRKHVEA